MTRLAEQEGTIRDQAGTIGRQGAELEAERAANKRYQADLAAAEMSWRRDRRRLSIALAVAGTLAIAVGLAPAWVR